MKASKVQPFRVRVDLEVMSKKDLLYIPQISWTGAHHQMQFSIILSTPFFYGSYPSVRDTENVFEGALTGRFINWEFLKVFFYPSSFKVILQVS